MGEGGVEIFLKYMESTSRRTVMVIEVQTVIVKQNSKVYVQKVLQRRAIHHQVTMEQIRHSKQFVFSSNEKGFEVLNSFQWKIFFISMAMLVETTTSINDALGQWAILQDNGINKNIHKGEREHGSEKHMNEEKKQSNKGEIVLAKNEYLFQRMLPLVHWAAIVWIFNSSLRRDWGWWCAVQIKFSNRIIWMQNGTNLRWLSNMHSFNEVPGSRALLHCHYFIFISRQYFQVSWDC